MRANTELKPSTGRTREFAVSADRVVPLLAAASVHEHEGLQAARKDFQSETANFGIPERE